MHSFSRTADRTDGSWGMIREFTTRFDKHTTLYPAHSGHWRDRCIQKLKSIIGLESLIRAPTSVLGIAVYCRVYSQVALQDMRTVDSYHLCQYTKR